MAGFTLNERQTSAVADVVDACSIVDGDAGLPWEVMRQVRHLLRADAISFSGLDTVVPRVWLMQYLEPWDEEGFDEPETPAEARHNPFWQTYWDGFCSYPDRSGDFDSVTTRGDFMSLADIRAAADGCEGEYERHISVFMRGRTPGRHLRLIGWRQRGSDFTLRDRFYLRMLKPHLETAFRAGALARQEPRLTQRELEVMTMVQAGLSNRQIAGRMGLSEGTVRTHLQNIYARLKVSSRTAAVHRVFGTHENWP
jgi:DNA-binding CsgD family transcriptional regulator